MNNLYPSVSGTYGGIATNVLIFPKRATPVARERAPTGCTRGSIDQKSFGLIDSVK
jgi:hypothetical protein